MDSKKLKIKLHEDWFRKDEAWIPKTHWLRKRGYRTTGYVFNRLLSSRELAYIKFLRKEINQHWKDIASMEKLKIEDINTYKEWKENQVKELKTEIDEVRWEGLTNSFCSY